MAAYTKGLNPIRKIKEACKSCLCILCLCLLLLPPLPVGGQAGGRGTPPAVRFCLTGREQHLQSPLLEREGLIFAPFRELISLLGGEVGFTAESSRPLAWAKLSGYHFLLEEGNPVVYRDEQMHILPAAPFQVENHLYLPLRFFANLAGYAVDWGEEGLNMYPLSSPGAGKEADPREDDVPRNDFFIHVLLLTAPEGLHSRGIYHHLQQSLVPNVTITVKTLAEGRSVLPGGSDASNTPIAYDLIYLDTNLATTAKDELEALKGQLMAYTAAGGVLFLSHEYANSFPQDFLGIKGLRQATSPGLDFAYPAVRKNLSGMQETWRSFAALYAGDNAVNPASPSGFTPAALAGAATVLVEREGLAYLLAHKVGDGLVIWAQDFLPNEQYITAFDFIPEDNQRYFHFGYAGANYLFRNALLKLVAQEKYGFSLEKSYGPYGRPGIAWQNHYEELHSLAVGDMFDWIDLLAGHNQIPSVSLIRGSFPWAQWQSSISVHLNQGTDDEPVFTGETENSFYSSGVRLATADDYLVFGSYPQPRTLLEEIELPHRAYPRIVDWYNQGKKDLIVGTADGQLYLVPDRGTLAGEPRPGKAESIYMADHKKMAVSSYAAPLAYDFSGNGLFDLLVGDGEGQVQLFLNKGASGHPYFLPAGPVLAGGERLQVGGCAAPFMVDWDGDGLPDLLVGNTAGEIIFFKGIAAAGKGAEQLAFAAGNPLMAVKAEVPAGGTQTATEIIRVSGFAAPFAVDWNNNGRLDLLVGGSGGEIALYLRDKGGTLVSGGSITGETYNFFGTKAIKTGHNSVPLVTDWNNDGKKDLLTGQLEYGIPYPLDSPLFPCSRQLRDLIAYAREKYIPLYPHLFFHAFLSDMQEKRELELHAHAFDALGIPWKNDTGANFHTWRINAEDPLRTFGNLAEAGIWWSFGFNPPRVGNTPGNGREFLLAVPFVLPAEGFPKPLILFTPAPDIFDSPDAWNTWAEFGLPLTYFQHIEHCLRPGTASYNNLLKKIQFMNTFKEQHEYNFMTEEQMARALLNTFFAEVRVVLEKDGIRLIPDYTQVPAQVGAYRGTLGLRLELGEARALQEVDTDSLFYCREKEGVYNIGLPSPTDISFVNESTLPGRIHLVRANGPVAVAEQNGVLILVINNRGMQEIKLYAPGPIRISGDNLKINRNGCYYTITHFGERATLTVKRTV